MNFDGLLSRLKFTPPEQVILDRFDQGPKYHALYIHVLDDGIYAQKGDLIVKINVRQLAKLLSLYT